MADRYWVGGNGTWNATAGLKWALTSGGLGGQAVPTSADDVYFDAGSGTVNVQIGASTCKNLNFSGFTGTLNVASTSTLNCHGSLTMVPMTSAWTGNINFLSTTAQTITSNGFTFDNPLTFNGVGGSWQLADNLTTGPTRTTTLTNGALDLSSGNRTLSTGLFSSNNSNTRSILFGTGNVTITGNGGTVLQVSTATGLTYTGTPTINFTYSGATGTRNLRFGNGGGFTETNSPNINITAGTDIVSFEGGAKNFSLNGFTGTFSNNPRTIYGNFTLTAGITLTAGALATTFAGTSGTQQITTGGITLDFPLTFNGIGGTFAFQDALTQGSTRAFTITNGTVQLKNGVTSTVGAFATSGINQKFLQSTTPGSQATLSQASGTVNASYLTIRDINATGGAAWNAYVDQSNIDAGNNDGWDFGISPVVGGAEYTYQLRSFTQPRRF